MKEGIYQRTCLEKKDCYLCSQSLSIAHRLPWNEGDTSTTYPHIDRLHYHQTAGMLVASGRISLYRGPHLAVAHTSHITRHVFTTAR